MLKRLHNCIVLECRMEDVCDDKGLPISLIDQLDFKTKRMYVKAMLVSEVIDKVKGLIKRIQKAEEQALEEWSDDIVVEKFARMSSEKAEVEGTSLEKAARLVESIRANPQLARTLMMKDISANCEIFNQRCEAADGIRQFIAKLKPSDTEPTILSRDLPYQDNISSASRPEKKICREAFNATISFNKRLSQIRTDGATGVQKEASLFFDKFEGLTMVMQAIEKLAGRTDGPEGTAPDHRLMRRLMYSMRLTIKHALGNVDRLKRDKGCHSPRLLRQCLIAILSGTTCVTGPSSKLSCALLSTLMITGSSWRMRHSTPSKSWIWKNTLRNSTTAHKP